MKYKKYYASKYKYPTRVVMNGPREGSLVFGYVNAGKDLEKKHNIKFSKDVKIKTRGGNWVFYQPIGENKDVSE